MAYFRHKNIIKLKTITMEEPVIINKELLLMLGPLLVEHLKTAKPFYVECDDEHLKKVPPIKGNSIFDILRTKEAKAAYDRACTMIVDAFIDHSIFFVKAMDGRKYNFELHSMLIQEHNIPILDAYVDEYGDLRIQIAFPLVSKKVIAAYETANRFQYIDKNTFNIMVNSGNLKGKDIIAVCSSESRINAWCDEDFFARLIRRDYPQTQVPAFDMSNKQLYLTLIKPKWYEITDIHTSRLFDRNMNLLCSITANTQTIRGPEVLSLELSYNGKFSLAGVPGITYPAPPAEFNETIYKFAIPEPPEKGLFADARAMFTITKSHNVLGAAYNTVRTIYVLAHDRFVYYVTTPVFIRPDDSTKDRWERLYVCGVYQVKKIVRITNPVIHDTAQFLYAIDVHGGLWWNMRKIADNVVDVIDIPAHRCGLVLYADGKVSVFGIATVLKVGIIITNDVMANNFLQELLQYTRITAITRSRTSQWSALLITDEGTVFSYKYNSALRVYGVERALPENVIRVVHIIGSTYAVETAAGRYPGFFVIWHMNNGYVASHNALLANGKIIDSIETYGWFDRMVHGTASLIKVKNP